VHSVSLVVVFFFFFFSALLFSPFCKDGLHRKQMEKPGKNERKAAITTVLMFLVGWLVALLLLLSTAANAVSKLNVAASLCVCVCVLLVVLLFCFDLLTLLFSVSSFLCNLVFNPIVLPFQLCQL
jgi:hypothetical protein